MKGAARFRLTGIAYLVGDRMLFYDRLCLERGPLCWVLEKCRLSRDMEHNKINGEHEQCSLLMVAERFSFVIISV